MTTLLLLDFDATLVRSETLDVLADVALTDAPDREARTSAIARATEQAMNGELDFRAALAQRLPLLAARREHLPKVIARLQRDITPSFARHRAFLAREATRIHIVSGGFREIIIPVAASLGLRGDHVHANDFVIDVAGNIIGFEADNPLASGDGKIAVARALAPDADAIMVGDGWSDYRVGASGAVARFYAFTENVAHPRVIAAAHHMAASFDDVLAEWCKQGEAVHWQA